MTRLINVDALMEAFAVAVEPSNNSDFVRVPTWNDAVSLVEGMPTIEAIPIDWIESQLDKGKWAELVQRWTEKRKKNHENLCDHKR